MEEKKQENGGFVVHVYSPGNQIIQTQNNTYYGTVYQGVGKGNASENGFTDEQVARALEACVGKGRVIDAKWKWAGAYWYLRWACNYPVDAQKFCERIGSLGLDVPDDYSCSYESIRKHVTLSFMNQDARQLQAVKPSKMDQQLFFQMREVVLKIAEELGKNSLV